MRVAGKQNSNSECLSFNMYTEKDTRELATVATIIGIAFIALGIAAFYTPVLWKGGVLPSLGKRVITLSIISAIGGVGALGPLLGSCILSHKLNSDR